MLFSDILTNSIKVREFNQSDIHNYNWKYLLKIRVSQSSKNIIFNDITNIASPCPVSLISPNNRSKLFEAEIEAVLAMVVCRHKWKIYEICDCRHYLRSLRMSVDGEGRRGGERRWSAGDARYGSPRLALAIPAAADDHRQHTKHQRTHAQREHRTQFGQQQQGSRARRHGRHRRRLHRARGSRKLLTHSFSTLIHCTVVARHFAHLKNFVFLHL